MAVRSMGDDGVRVAGGSRIAFDERARDALRLGTHAAREVAASVSDALMAALIVVALAVDAFALPLMHEAPFAWRATGAYTLAIGLTLVLGDLVKHATGRARPFERLCREDPSFPGANNRDTYASFYSLHTAVAFTSAGFSCAMHLSRAVYGEASRDALSCGAALAAAAAIGLLRISADRHYLSDVAVGALVGAAMGFVIPLST